MDQWGCNTRGWGRKHTLMKKYQVLIDALPYGPSFLFVDEIKSLDAESIVATYCFKKDWPVFRDHFPGNPVVPGVHLTECAAQIGLALHGLFLLQEQDQEVSEGQMAFSESQMEFLRPVYPDDILTIRAELIYFRFNKIKTKVRVFKEAETLVAKGSLSGILITQKQ